MTKRNVARTKKKVAARQERLILEVVGRSNVCFMDLEGLLMDAAVVEADEEERLTGEAWEDDGVKAMWVRDYVEDIEARWTNVAMVQFILDTLGDEQVVLLLESLGVK